MTIESKASKSRLTRTVIRTRENKANQSGGSEMQRWFDDTGFIHYHSKDDLWNRQQTDGFGDSPHHTGFYITARILLGELTTTESKDFDFGTTLRTGQNGVIRHTRTHLHDEEGRAIGHQLSNRDQATTWVYPARMIDPVMAEIVYKQTKMLMWPHQWLHFRRSLGKKTFKPLTWICELFELADAWTDKHWPNNSSLVKNFFRVIVARWEDETWVTKINWWYLNKNFSGHKAFREYFTYKHEERDSPPPIHKVWIRLLEKELED